MRLTREIKRKIAVEHGKGKGEKIILMEHSQYKLLACMLVLRLSKDKNSTAKHQVTKLKRLRSDLVSTYRRLDKEASLKLEESLGIMKHRYHHKH